MAFSRRIDAGLRVGELGNSSVRYEIGLCKRGMLKGYVGIPVWKFPRGDYPFGYLGRWAGEDDDPDADRPRYKWPKNFPKRDFLYGFEQALEGNPAQPLIVVEGPFKVYHLVQRGFSSTVAIFGSFLSDAQTQLLINTGGAIVLMFDGDDAGLTGMRQAAAKLITAGFVRVIKLPEGQEPDQLPDEQLASLLSFAYSYAAAQ